MCSASVESTKSETNPSAGTLMHDSLENTWGTEVPGYLSAYVEEPPSGVERGVRLALGQSAIVPVRESGGCSWL